jgi:RNA-directed DNA polymerase
MEVTKWLKPSISVSRIGPVQETEDRGRRTRRPKPGTTGAASRKVHPSPHMRRFVLGWKMRGLEQSLGSHIVTYADDLVILCGRGKAEEALAQLRKIMGKLKLTVNVRVSRDREHGFQSIVSGSFVGS